MKPETPFVIVGLLLFGAFLIFISRGQIHRGREMLERWVKAQNRELTSCECCWFFKGPFFWSTRGREVFRFSTRDKDGVVKSGYARCRGFWFGTWSEQVEVRWDP